MAKILVNALAYILAFHLGCKVLHLRNDQNEYFEYLLHGAAGTAAGTAELDSAAEMLDSAEMLGSDDRAAVAAAVAA